MNVEQVLDTLLTLCETEELQTLLLACVFHGKLPC